MHVWFSAPMENRLDNRTQHEDKIFKRCPKCMKCWQSRDEFIRDKSLELNGYQADFEELEFGMFHFTHLEKQCCSTMVIRTRDFLNLYTGKKYTERKTGSKECPGYCLHQDQLDRCSAMCEYAFVREVIHIIQVEKGQRPETGM